MASSSHARSVLITGCSDSGIGSALAIAFQRRGFTVFATVRSPEKASAIASLPNVTIIIADITNPKSIAETVEIVRQKTSDNGLDILINNAAQGFPIPLVDSDLDTGRKLFEINFWAVLAMVQAFMPMLIQSKGTIVNVSSISAIMNVPYLGIYGSSKAALTLASDTLRLEVRPLGVNVITVIVGSVHTRVQDKVPPVVLPEGSPYVVVEKQINDLAEVPEEKDQMPVDRFAEELFNDILAGKTGHIYKGAMSSTARYLNWFMPTWILVRFFRMQLLTMLIASIGSYYESEGWSFIGQVYK
jgi:1-acylglycerone phosphate reductase